MVRVNADNVDVTSGRAVKYSPEVMAKINELTTPFFVRTMYNAMAFAGRGQRHGGYHTELPAEFVKEDGDKFGRFVTLEGPTGEVWEVRLKITLSGIQARVGLAEGWREFSLDHMLERGDLLLFSVVMNSKFVVSIFSQAGKLVQRRQVTNPIRSGDEVHFPSRTLQFPEDDNSSQLQTTAVPPSSSSKQRRSSRESTRSPGKKKRRNLTASTSKLKPNRVSSRPKNREDQEQLSETEDFKFLEEVASGYDKESRIIDGKPIEWEELEDCTTMSTNACYSPDFAMDLPESTEPPADEQTIDPSDTDSEPLWPTY